MAETRVGQPAPGYQENAGCGNFAARRGQGTSAGRRGKSRDASRLARLGNSLGKTEHQQNCTRPHGITSQSLWDNSIRKFRSNDCRGRDSQRDDSQRDTHFYFSQRDTHFYFTSEVCVPQNAAK
jgi:hypothetical protein